MITEKDKIDIIKGLKGCIIQDANFTTSESRRGTWEELKLDLLCNGKPKKVNIYAYGYEGIWGTSAELVIETDNQK